MSYIWLIICVIIWGSNFVFGKILVDYFSPATITVYRLLMITFFLLSLKWLFYRDRQIIRKEHILWIVLFGVFGVFVNHFTFYQGLVTADPTSAALVLATTPIMASLMATVFLKEKFTLKMGIGSIIAIIGVSYVATGGDFLNVAIDRGLFWIVGTMLTFASMIIITRYLGGKVDPFHLTLYGTIVGLIASIPLAFFTNTTKEYQHPDWKIWLLLIVTAIGVHGIATIMWNRYIRDVEAAKASMLTNLEPFVAMVFGLVLLANPVTAVELVGAVFIIVGVSLSTYEGKRRKHLPMEG